MTENNNAKNRRGVTLRSPEDIRRMIQRICSKAFQEGAELENAGKISQLATCWLKAWELSAVSDLEQRLTKLELELRKK